MSPKHDGISYTARPARPDDLGNCNDPLLTDYESSLKSCANAASVPIIFRRDRRNAGYLKFRSRHVKQCMISLPSSTTHSQEDRSTRLVDRSIAQVTAGVKLLWRK